MTNLSLYSKVAIGCDPKDLSGIILATRFACKCLSGLAPTLHGALAQWLGFPASFAFGCISALMALWFVLRLAPQTVGAGR